MPYFVVIEGRNKMIKSLCVLILNAQADLFTHFKTRSFEYIEGEVFKKHLYQYVFSLLADSDLYSLQFVFFLLYYFFSL